jgi:hypothetical protein
MSTPFEIRPAHLPLIGGGVDLRLRRDPLACVSAIQGPMTGASPPESMLAQ